MFTCYMECAKPVCILKEHKRGEGKEKNLFYGNVTLSIIEFPSIFFGLKKNMHQMNGKCE